MDLPNFNAEGDLPAGVYRATMKEVLARFGVGSVERKKTGATLQRIFDLAKSASDFDRLVIFGSFVTAKPRPNDVDVMLVMRDAFQLENCPADLLPLFDHSRAEQEFGASVFWIRPGLLIVDTVDQFIQRWQLKREGGQRGIVEVVE